MTFGTLGAWLLARLDDDGLKLLRERRPANATGVVAFIEANLRHRFSLMDDEILQLFKL